MRPRILDVVGYIGRFVSAHWDSIADHSEITDELMNLGFSDAEISDAFQWIERHTLGLKDQKVVRGHGNITMRPLGHSERAKFSAPAYGLLVDLVGRGILDALTLEEVIEKCMKSEPEELNKEEVRRVTALTLFNHHQPEWSELLHTTNTLVH